MNWLYCFLCLCLFGHVSCQEPTNMFSNHDKLRLITGNRQDIGPLEGQVLSGIVYIGLDDDDRKVINPVQFFYDGIENYVQQENAWTFDFRGTCSRNNIYPDEYYAGVDPRNIPCPLNTFDEPDGVHFVKVKSVNFNTDYVFFVVKNDYSVPTIPNHKCSEFQNLRSLIWGKKIDMIPQHIPSNITISGCQAVNAMVNIDLSTVPGGDIECSGPICTQEECCVRTQYPEPIDGGWSRWMTCPNSCGYPFPAEQERYCTFPSPKYGGLDCTDPMNGLTNTSVPLFNSTKPCYTVFKNCTVPLNTTVVDGGWSEWTNCTLDCGGGTQQRKCDNPAPMNGGNQCMPGYNIQNCNTEACYLTNATLTLNCTYLDEVGITTWAVQNVCQGGWTDWTPCTKSCGGGTRHKACTKPYPSIGYECPGQLLSSSVADVVEICNPQACPIRGGWTAWSTCCNNVRTHECTNPVPSNGGATCVGPSTLACDSATELDCGAVFPVDCQGAWTPWRCDIVCGADGEGTETRTFLITTPGANGGSLCPSVLTQTGVCGTNGQALPKVCTITDTDDTSSSRDTMIVGGIAVASVTGLVILGLLISKRDKTPKPLKQRKEKQQKQSLSVGDARSSTARESIATDTEKPQTRRMSRAGSIKLTAQALARRASSGLKQIVGHQQPDINTYMEKRRQSVKMANKDWGGSQQSDDSEDRRVDKELRAEARKMRKEAQREIREAERKLRNAGVKERNALAYSQGDDFAKEESMSSSGDDGLY